MYQRTGGGGAGNLSALFEMGGSPTPSTGSVNTPVTPFQHLGGGGGMGMGLGKSLAQIAEDLHGYESRERSFEEENGDEQVLEYPSHLSSSGGGASLLDDEELFGSVALDMQRKRKADGMGVLMNPNHSGGLGGAFELSSPPPPASATLPKSPSLLNSSLLPRSPPMGGSFGRHGPQYQTPFQGHQALPPTPQRSSQQHQHRLSTFTSSSRFTSMQPPRHPLSLHALNQALQAALLSRRYTCSHLLALRFSEEGQFTILSFTVLKF
jgi:hypothetical protein